MELIFTKNIDLKNSQTVNPNPFIELFFFPPDNLKVVTLN